MRCRIYIRTVERAGSGVFNWVNLICRHCVLVPVPFAGADEELALGQWWEDHGGGE